MKMSEVLPVGKRENFNRHYKIFQQQIRNMKRTQLVLLYLFTFEDFVHTSYFSVSVYSQLKSKMIIFKNIDYLANEIRNEVQAR